MEKGRRLLQDYDAVMDKVAEAEELSADHRPSTLENLAELASDTSRQNPLHVLHRNCEVDDAAKMEPEF